jgi:hypothetical protein
METNNGQAMTAVEPQKEHRWLRKFIGEWTYEGDAIMAPDQPPTRVTGRQSIRPLGELWIVGEGSGSAAGHEDKSLLTLGYDPNSKRFVGTFISSEMAYLWIYEGKLESGETRLPLNAEGPGMEPGRVEKYHDIYELRDDNHWVLTSEMLGKDGKWQQFMEMHYHRAR